MDRLVYDFTTGQITTVPFTPAEATEKTALVSADQAAQAAAVVFRGQIVAIAQTAVGITLANLTPAQIKALAAVLLYKAGGVDPATLQVRPLDQWM